MSKPAARVGDMHTCPMSDGPKPHVGGPILPPGVPTVLIGGMPAATVSNMCTCVGPPDSIIMGSATVLIGGKPAARLGDSTAHGGVITVGCPTVLIGGAASGGSVTGSKITAKKASSLKKEGSFFQKVKGVIQKMINWVLGTDKEKEQTPTQKAVANARLMLNAKLKELEKWDDNAKANVKKWMGDDTEATKKLLTKRIEKTLKALEDIDDSNFKKAEEGEEDCYAYVYADDENHNVYLGDLFDSAPDTGENSKAGTVLHEVSHFEDVAETDDVVHPACEESDDNTCYGPANAEALAKESPEDAQRNADNFEYYLEH